MEDSCKKRRLERMEILKMKRSRRDGCDASNFSSISSCSSYQTSSTILLSKEDERKKRNRESAEKSRKKKIQQIDSLTFQVYELYSTYCDLVDENDRLRSIQYSELIQSCQFSNSSDVSDMSVDSDDGSQSPSIQYETFPILANMTKINDRGDNNNSNSDLVLNERLFYDDIDIATTMLESYDSTSGNDANVFIGVVNDDIKHVNVIQSNPADCIIQQELQLHDDFRILEELTLDELDEFLRELEMENSLKWFDS